jgi:hypothetical protein
VGGRRCPVTLDHTLATATQSDIPVGFSLDADILDDIAAYTENWPNDLRISSDEAGATELNYEYKSDGQIWVKVPTYSASVDTVIWVWYGCAAASAPAASWGQGVWDANYTGVYHLEQATDADAPDSTSNGATLAKAGTTVTTATGKIGQGIQFGNGRFGSDNIFTNFTALTVECWRTYGGAGDREIFNNGSGYFEWADYGTYSIISAGDGSATAFRCWTSFPANDGSFHKMDITFVGGASLNVYYDGVNDDGAFSGTVGPKFEPFNNHYELGQYYGAYSWAGIMDELRLSNVARAADWLKTNYQTQNALATIATSGEPETVSANNAPVVKVFMVD